MKSVLVQLILLWVLLGVLGNYLFPSFFSLYDCAFYYIWDKAKDLLFCMGLAQFLTDRRLRSAVNCLTFLLAARLTWEILVIFIGFDAANNAKYVLCLYLIIMGVILKILWKR